MWRLSNLLISPGFIGREWIETTNVSHQHATRKGSPGFIGREWIETRGNTLTRLHRHTSPGFIGREWIETTICCATGASCWFSRLYWSGVD